MIGELVVSMALMGQAKVAPPQATPNVAAAQRAQLIAKRKAKKAAIATDNRVREATRQATEAYAREQAMAQAERLLPYQLEHQRQMLQRMSDVERNAALHRNAASLERLSGFRTPYNSSLPTGSPQIAPHLR